MRPKPEMFCPIAPFDRDISRMSPDELRAYAASLPSAEYPAVRWPGDGLDAHPGPGGVPLGPATGDDLAAFFVKGAGGEWRDIGGKTVVDLGALVQAFEERCRRTIGDDPKRWPALVLARCLIKGANLEGRTVGVGLRLLTCTVVGPARFTFTRFAEGIDLLGTLWAEMPDFTATVFEDHAHFAAAVFLRGVRFRETRFEADARFNETAFNGPVCLDHARFAETVDLSPAIFQGATWIDLFGLRVSGRTALAGDLKIRLEQIEGRVLGEHGQRLSAPDDPSVPSRRERQESLQHAADQYSMLAGNFAASPGPGTWHAADWCHSRYLDLRRQIAWLRGRYWEWLKNVLFKVCLGNGIWVKYPLELALAVILGFGLLYAVALAHEIRADKSVLAGGGPAAAPYVGAAGSGPHAEVGCLGDIDPAYARLATALYYSAITFTTVGYGDWHPVGWARLFAAIEALSGITIMSAFTVILVRKIIR